MKLNILTTKKHWHSQMKCLFLEFLTFEWIIIIGDDTKPYEATHFDYLYGLRGVFIIFSKGRHTHMHLYFQNYITFEWGMEYSICSNENSMLGRLINLSKIWIIFHPHPIQFWNKYKNWAIKFTFFQSTTSFFLLLPFFVFNFEYL